MKIADFFAELALKPDRQSFELGERLMSRVKQAVVGLAAYSSIQWARGMIRQVADLGGRLDDLAQQNGVNVETLQQLGYAAMQGGSTLEAMASSLGKLSKKQADAAKGGGESAEAFKRLGVAFKNADGTLRPADEMLGDIAEKIASMPDGTAKTAAAMEIFGRTGKDMIPMLNEGRDGLARLRQEFLDLGGQMSEADVKALADYGDEVDKIGVAFDGLRNQIVIGILPYLRQMVKSWVEWWKANRALIKQRIDQTLKILIPIFKVLAKVASVAFDVIGGVIQLILNWIEILKIFVREFDYAIGAAIGMFAALKFAAIQAALATAAAWALPLAAIAAIALLGEDIFQWSTGGESALKDIHTGLVRMFVEAIEFWVKALEDFFAWFDKKVTAIAKEIRTILPEFLGGYSDEERRQNFAADAGVPNAVWNDPRLEGVDFFSPEYDRISEQLAEEDRIKAEGRRSVASIPINAPISITVNGATAADPNEIARLVQVKLEGIMRTARDAMKE